MDLRIITILTGGILFIISTAGYFYVRLKLKPRYDKELDDYYYEFEDKCEPLVSYERWSRICLTGVVVAMLLVFIAAFI